MPKSITTKQKAFAEYFILGGDHNGITTLGNAKQSYAKAYGVKLSTAETSGPRLMSNDVVCSEIQRLIAAKAEQQQAKIDKTAANASKTLDQLACIGYSDITEAVAGTYRTIYEMHKAIEKQSDDIKAAISELHIREYIRGGDDGESGHVELKIKLHDKIQALKVLTRYFGLDGSFQYARAILKTHGIAMLPDQNSECGWRLEKHEVKGAND